MAFVNTREFEPYSNGLGGHNRVFRGAMAAAAATAATSFGRGSPVFINASGFVDTPPKDGTPILLTDIGAAATGGRIAGIALHGPEDPTGAVVAGLNHADWRTGAAYATGADITFIPFGDDQLWVTRNVQSAAGTNVAPTFTLVGDSFEIIFDSTSATALQGWTILTTAAPLATEVGARVLAILDSAGRPYPSTATPVIGDRVVCKITAERA